MQLDRLRRYERDCVYFAPLLVPLPDGFVRAIPLRHIYLLATCY